MNMRILVYDRQKGYYEWLRKEMAGRAKVIHTYTFSAKENYDMIIFFMHDSLEMLDIVKAHNKNIPFIICSSLEKNGEAKLAGKNTPQIIRLSMHKNQILDAILKSLPAQLRQVQDKKKPA